ncbi:serpin family protein [Streptomyces iakyrus]|uniref:serpin family protein n=1 Tax=Streptomyces iakyrus TaxID=68219 RepID=UPI0033DCE43E
MGVATTTVRAVNGLTARWAGVSEDGTAFSAAGVWPLLAHLAGGAEGAARAELAEALGLPAAQARDAANELLAAMSAMRGLDTALGLWTKRTLELREEWEAGLPADAHGVLTGDPVADHQALDAWAVKRTAGLIDRMPVTLAEDTEMVLASALTMRTQWLSPFQEVDLETAYEPWAGNVGPGLLVEKVRRTRPESPSLDVTTVAYHMNASHDLLALHRLFGLTTAQDTSRGHFPGVSDFPLAIGSAKQNIMATFGARGFEAAAVTAFGAVAGCVPDLRYVTTRIRAAFDRPFGFLALHRHTRLVLTAGWVTDPLLLPEYDGEPG